MGATIEQFGSECRAILKTDPGPDGVERVRRRLEDVLVDAEFVARHLGPANTETRKILYEDPELGFASWPTSTSARRRAVPTIMVPPGRSMARPRARRS